jgi:hypothetical protein
LRGHHLQRRARGPGAAAGDHAAGQPGAARPHDADGTHVPGLPGPAGCLDDRLPALCPGRRHAAPRAVLDRDDGPEDYSITFAFCQDVYGHFNHIKFLSDEIAALVAARECNTYDDGGAGPCETQLFDSIPAGTLLKQVGRLQGNFDFGALDMRVTNTFANPDRYQFARTPHIVCPYDYFEGDLRAQFYARIPRTQEPRCGTATQDARGTLRGVWFQPASDIVIGWEGHLSFVPDNYEPTTSVIAIGGTIADPGRVEFTPAASGTVNRTFIDVTETGTLYCYQRDGTARHERVQNPDLISGKILVQLVSATELQVEHQSGTCGSADAFIPPTSYFR